MTNLDDPGLHVGITDAEYFAHPALSNSGAKLLLPPNCPALYRWHADHPEARKPKAEFDEGHAAHQLVLGAGPKLVLIPYPNRMSKAAKEWIADARADGEVPLLQDQWDKVHAMAEAVREHPVAGPLFDDPTGKPEQVVRWQQYGIPWRAKFDWLPDPDDDGTLIVVDFKTAADAEPRAFARSAAKLGYAMQDAVYSDAGLTLPGVQRVLFLFVVTMKEPPYLSSVIELEAEDIEIGRGMAGEAARIFELCTVTGHWPDWTNGEPTRVQMPAWWRSVYGQMQDASWSVDQDEETDEGNY